MTSAGGVHHKTVWLTTDPSAKGHGLLTGREVLTASQIAHMERIQGGSLSNRSTHNKSQIRIGIELDPSKTVGLHSFTKYCSKNESKDYAKIYGLSALYDLKKLSDAQLKRLVKKSLTKENTWWLSFAPISPDHFVSADFNVGNDKFIPYDFEKHGRNALEQYGFAVPRKETLDSLQGLFAVKRHRLEHPKALLICQNLSSTPSVVIRGNGKMQAFDLCNGQPIDGSNVLADVDGIDAWIATNSEELQGCWQMAIDRYKVFYPD